MAPERDGGGHDDFITFARCVIPMPPPAAATARRADICRPPRSSKNFPLRRSVFVVAVAGPFSLARTSRVRPSIRPSFYIAIRDELTPSPGLGYVCLLFAHFSISLFSLKILTLCIAGQPAQPSEWTVVVQSG